MCHECGMQVEEIIERLEGSTRAALKLGLKRQAIEQWRARGRIPPIHVPRVAHALGVAPEVVWPALAVSPPPPPLSSHQSEAQQVAA
jgi:DNA-binding transcriptional regulator YdaS (Cro superfamily)